VGIEIRGGEVLWPIVRRKRVVMDGDIVSKVSGESVTEVT
jgi:hypothetical protein